ncbi:MAG: hypothetical protein JW731_10015, partial [Bacteroidales bacterium]|nr:hypothetical protein [Bacteroidales bacterium]
MKNTVFYISFILILLTSCFKEDDPLPAFPVQSTTIEMGKYYLYQVYLNLATNEQVKINDKNDYDLAFECGDSSWHVLLNTAAFMFAGNTGIKDFDAPIDTTGLDWRFDKSDGNPDSTAIGEWYATDNPDTVYTNFVYVLNRGYDHLGNLRGLKKIAFTGVDSVSYRFKYADLNGDNYHEFEIIKNNNFKHTYFSFDEGGKQLDREPLPVAWDLLFTQYTTLLFTNEGEPYPYLVTGVLSNTDRVAVALDTLSSFENVDLEYARSKSYSETQDFIGYDWKELQGDVNSGNIYYEIVPNRNYLIRLG